MSCWEEDRLIWEFGISISDVLICTLSPGRRLDFFYRCFIKKVLSHIFIITVNYYLLMLLAGTVLMFLTIFGISYSSWMILLVNVIALTVCISYQLKRQNFKQQSIGELIIGNDDKDNVLRQDKKFTVTRVPLFILLIVTLLLTGNLLNGLAESIKFGITDVIYSALVFICIYYGFKNFFLRPDWLPLILICGGVFLVGFIFKTQHNILLFNICYVLGVVWLLIGLLYKKTSTLQASDE